MKTANVERDSSMRRKLTIVLFIISFFTFCACSNEKESTGYDEKANAFNGAIPATATTTPATIAETNKEKKYVKLENGRDFSDGIAWVRYYDQNAGEVRMGLLNTNGEIISNDFLSTLGSSEFGSDFSAGYSYVNHYDVSNKVNNAFYIVDKNGNVVVSSPDDGTGYQILAGGDGVFFVCQQILDMKTNEERYGFVDAKGNWIVELTTDNPLKYGFASEKVSKRGGALSYYYLGENSFAALVEDYFDCLAIYNVDTGASQYYDNEDSIDTSPIVLTNHNSNKPFTFSNGLSMVIWHDSVCSLDKNGELTEIIVIPGGYDGTQVIYYDGVFLFGDVQFHQTWEMRNGIFYDLYGNAVLDMSDYSLAVYGKLDGFYEFHNGLAAVKIVGADGKYYISHIDKSGNFQYEPVAIWHAGNVLGHGKGSGDAMYVILDDGRLENYVLQSSGEINKMIDEVKIRSSEASEAEFTFSCGYAWSKKNCFYVGKDGMVLHTYVIQ